MESIFKTTESMETISPMSRNKAIRYKGQWYEIASKKYESERQTYQIALLQLTDNLDVLESYRIWYKKEQENSKLLYPSFCKE